MLVVCCLTCTAPEAKLALANDVINSSAKHSKGDAEGKVGDKPGSEST